MIERLVLGPLQERLDGLVVGQGGTSVDEWCQVVAQLGFECLPEPPSRLVFWVGLQLAGFLRTRRRATSTDTQSAR